MKHYLIVGRKHGDDEATAEPIQATDRETAIDGFKATILTDAEHSELIAIEQDGNTPEDIGRYDLLVYIDGVFTSDSPIEQC